MQLKTNKGLEFVGAMFTSQVCNKINRNFHNIGLTGVLGINNFHIKPIFVTLSNVIAINNSLAVYYQNGDIVSRNYLSFVQSYVTTLVVEQCEHY